MGSLPLGQGIQISPMTPSPGDHTLPLNTKREPLDPSLTDTVKRLEKVRSNVLERLPEDDSSENDESFCRSFHAWQEPQQLVHTMSNTIDPILPQVWSGSVRKGPTRRCDGFLVLNSNQNEEAVRKTINELTKDIKIGHRGKWEGEAFAHLPKPESVVVIVKSAKEDGKVTNGRRRAGLRYRCRGKF